RVWSPDGAAASPWMRHDARLVQVNFHPAGRTVVTAGYESLADRDIGVVQSWDLDRAAPGDFRLVIGAGRASQAGYSPDGSRVLLVGPFAANVWDRGLRRDVVGINPGDHLRHAAFSPDGSRVAVATRVGFATWGLAGGIRYRIKDTDLAHIAFSPDGRSV